MANIQDIIIPSQIIREMHGYHGRGGIQAIADFVQFEIECMLGITN